MTDLFQVGTKEYFPMHALSFSSILLAESGMLRSVGEDCCYAIPGKIMAEAGFALTLVIALVEAVFRAILAIPASLVGLVCEEEAQEKLRQLTWVGAKISLTIAVAALVAMGKNFFMGSMEEKDIYSESLQHWADETLS
ncbi:MAG: hypothetical protein HYX48_07895 [Chlamydiales bacterium]|nr:hypothetical protein [Chlamydiales bacterium]